MKPIFVPVRPAHWLSLILGGSSCWIIGCSTPYRSPEKSAGPPANWVAVTEVAKPAATAAATAAATVAVLAPGVWRSLFDQKTLTGWKLTEFAGGGDAKVQPAFRGAAAAIVVDSGESLSGITWTNEVPSSNFEISLEAMKLEGSDFFCGLTFPVGKENATLVLGGWGGATVGISSLDGMDASENDTTKFLNFKKDQWFRVRLRVTPARIEFWLDDEKVIDQELEGRRISMRFGDIELSKPLGIATYQTRAAFRELKLRRLE